MRLGLSVILFFIILAPLAGLGDESASFTVDVKLRGTGVSALEVNIVCGPADSFETRDAIPVDSSRSFAIPVPAGQVTICELSARSLPGHQLKFLGDGGSEFDPDSPGCRFTGIRAGHSNFCQIQVENQETSLTVFKRWIGTSKREESVAVYLDCGRGLDHAPLSINEGAPGAWSLDVNDADGFSCTVTEEESEAWIADTSDCENLLIFPGAREECTLVNTKVVKMIEMLNRYGLVIMILVFMGVGGFAARKFIP